MGNACPFVGLDIGDEELVVVAVLEAVVEAQPLLLRW